MAPVSVLVQRAGPDQPWQRLRPNNDRVSGTDRLVSLPGYRSQLRFDSGVRLVLWGNLPEFWTTPLILESVVVLHANPDVDLDFTLDHGRVVLGNLKPDGPARVRVRFQEEVWELTLPDTTSQVSLELFGLAAQYTRELRVEPPLETLILLTLAGQAQLRVRYQEFQLPSSSFFLWDNIGPAQPSPQRLPKLPEWWTSNKVPPRKEARVMELALEELRKRLTGKAVDIVLAEALKDPEESTRTLAVRSLAALDNLPKVLDALDDERHPDTRFYAIQSLRHWLGERADHDKQLVDVLVKQKKYTPSQAETVVQLVHGFTEKELGDPTLRGTLGEYLNHARLPIRQLAHTLLSLLVPEGRKIPYDPAGETAQRELGAEQWRKLLEGKAAGKAAPLK
jgi:hypothetical protein